MATDKENIDNLKRNWTPQDYYTYTDLNNIEWACLIVRNQIGSYRGTYPTLLSTVTNRTQSSIEFADSLNRIEANIETLRNSFPVYGFGSYKNWTINMPFDFSDANRFAQSLYDMWYNIENNKTLQPYCGMYITGQEGVY